MAIVWACPLGVDAYATAGRDVEVPRPSCPGCARPMIFWPGYARAVRAGAVHRIWVRRARCRPCDTSHALLPSFCLVGRLDHVEVVGATIAAVTAGAGVRTAAAAVDVPHTTARDWRRRHRDRAPLLIAGFLAVAVSLNHAAPDLEGAPERRALAAASVAVSAVTRRLGQRAPPPWEVVGLVTGGEWLATTTNPPWAGAGGRAQMAGVCPVPASMEARCPTVPTKRSPCSVSPSSPRASRRD